MYSNDKLTPKDITDPVAHDILATIEELRINKDDHISLEEICEETAQVSGVAELFIEQLLTCTPPLIIGDAKNGFKITPLGTLQNKQWLKESQRPACG